MEAIQRTLSLIESALPSTFAFYHLGKVDLISEVPEGNDIFGPHLTSSDAGPVVAFSLQGDVQAAVLVALEPGNDLSTYMEMGNILASQLATRLAERSGLDTMISPPRQLSRNQASALRGAAGSAAIEKTYLHSHKNRIVPLHVVIILDSGAPFSTAREVTGYA